MSGIKIKVTAPNSCATLAQLVTRENGEWLNNCAGETTTYPLPVTASAEVWDYLRPLTKVTSSGAGIAKLPAGRVLAAGAVLSSDGTLLARDVSGDHGNDATHHWLVGYPGLRTPSNVSGSVAVAAVNLGESYAHWLLEELPRLLTMPTGQAENLVVHSGAAYVHQALQMRGGTERVIAAKRRLHIACAPLFVPRLVAEPGAPNRWSLELIENFTEPLGRSASRFGERLYFTREKARRRRVKNEAELWRELETHGFVKVALEDLTWDEQIAACRRARVVVAPHGAGLANLVFCPTGARVVELVNRAYYNPGYWRLTALRGLDYRVVVSGGDGRLREDRRANREDILTDVEEVRRAII